MKAISSERRGVWAVLVATLLAGFAMVSSTPLEGQTVAAPATNRAADSSSMARGIMAYMAGDVAGAATLFRGVLQRTPTHYGAQYQLAKVLDLAGKGTEARAEWQKFVPMAQQNRDSSFLAEARSRLARADTLSQAALMTLAMDLRGAKKQPGLAVVQYRLVLQRNPSHYGAQYQIAAALDEAGRQTEAREYWVKMLPVAEAQKDQATVAKVKARLAQTP